MSFIKTEEDGTRGVKLHVSIPDGPEQIFYHTPYLLQAEAKLEVSYCLPDKQ
jgi:hypothetical protein